MTSGDSKEIPATAIIVGDEGFANKIFKIFVDRELIFQHTEIWKAIMCLLSIYYGVPLQVEENTNISTKVHSKTWGLIEDTRISLKSVVEMSVGN